MIHSIVKMVADLTAEVIKSECILSVYLSPISNNGATIQITDESFLALFSEFSFEALSSSEYRIMITTYIDGVKIIAITEPDTLGLFDNGK